VSARSRAWTPTDGVPVNAGDGEIVRNYRLLSVELLHDDRNPENPVGAALLFNRVTGACHTLGNSARRAAFNSIRPTDAHYDPARNVFGGVPVRASAM
jgi:curved DNA-binding protein CbpA